MVWRPTPGDPRGDERLIRQLPALLREPRPELMVRERLYRSPAGFTSWSSHWAKAVAVELALEHSESIADHVGIWGGMVCRWAMEIGAEPRFLSLAALRDDIAWPAATLWLLDHDLDPLQWAGSPVMADRVELK